MTTQTEVTIDGITFDCEWYADYDHTGEWVELEQVLIGGQDLTGIISHEWWCKIEAELIRLLERNRRMDEEDAALSRAEAWGV